MTQPCFNHWKFKFRNHSTRSLITKKIGKFTNNPIGFKTLYVGFGQFIMGITKSADGSPSMAWEITNKKRAWKLSEKLGINGNMGGFLSCPKKNPKPSRMERPCEYSFGWTIQNRKFMTSTKNWVTHSYTTYQAYIPCNQTICNAKICLNRGFADFPAIFEYWKVDITPSPNSQDPVPMVLGLNWSYHICKVDVRPIWYLATLDILNMLQIRNVTKLTGAANCIASTYWPTIQAKKTWSIHISISVPVPSLWLNYVTSRTNLKIVIYY